MGVWAVAGKVSQRIHGYPAESSDLGFSRGGGASDSLYLNSRKITAEGDTLSLCTGESFEDFILNPCHGAALPHVGG